MADDPVTLSDAVLYDAYNSYFAVDDVETTNFYQAGIIATNDVLTAVARQGAKQVHVPFWHDLDPTIEPNYSNSDFTDESEMHGLDSGEQLARTVWVNQSFGAMDLVSELANSSPMARIRERFATYWQRQLQRRVIADCTGVLADNVANDSGDMLVDISGNSGDAAVFNADTFIDAAYTLGDHVENFTAIAVNSLIMARMVKNDEIVYIPDSKGALTVPTYKGRLVVTDDGLPTSGSGADRIYTSILFGGGAFGFGGARGSVFGIGVGQPQVPVEVFRFPSKGNGGGAEAIWERNTWLIHPFGFSWIESSLDSGEFSPSLSDLRLAKHWNRVLDRKLIPLVFMKTKA